MPIHLIWGNDIAGRERYINALIKKEIDPAWSSFNLTRIDGSESNNAIKALEESRSEPLGSGSRITLLNNSPFCNGCNAQVATLFEEALDLIPFKSHLILNNQNKPDGRLKTTKSLQKLINAKGAIEKHFLLPAIWDNIGQKKLINQIATELEIEIESEAIDALIEAIGSDSVRLYSEIKKLSLHAEADQSKEKQINNLYIIKAESVKKLIEGISTNALQIGDSLLNKNFGEAISRLDALLDNGEPSLRIMATLIGQVRGWLWVSLLEQEGERDVNVIAKAAGIGNPKRIYVMRKQLKGQSPGIFLQLLSQLLEVEAEIKRGLGAKEAFRDGFLSTI